MRNILVLFFFLFVTISANCQKDYIKLSEYPTISKYHIVEIIVGRETENGKKRSIEKKLSVDWSLVISANQIIIKDYDKRGQEQLEILEVGTYKDGPGTYYFQVQSKVDGSYGEILVNDKLISYSKAYQEEIMMIMRYEKIY